MLAGSVSSSPDWCFPWGETWSNSIQSETGKSVCLSYLHFFVPMVKLKTIANAVSFSPGNEIYFSIHNFSFHRAILENFLKVLSGNFFLLIVKCKCCCPSLFLLFTNEIHTIYLYSWIYHFQVYIIVLKSNHVYLLE